MKRKKRNDLKCRDTTQ